MAFLATPLGLSLAAEVPDLIGKIIGIWVKKGLVTPEEIADYVSAQWLDPASLIHKPKVTG